LFIVGGLGAISQSVEDALKAAGISTIERIYGADRYETSVKIAEKMGSPAQAVLATGSDFPDALSVSGIASKLGMPILLTTKDSLPTVVNNYFQANAITRTYIIGGTGVISSNVENSVPGSSRLAGSNRYETNKAILQNFESEYNFENIYVATGGGLKGNAFADALTGAVLAAKTSSPLILSGPTLPTVTADYLKAKLLLATKVIGLGGQQAVASSVLTELLAYKEQISVAQKYDKAGTYGSEAKKTTIEGSVIISAADVTLRNIEIKGDLLIAQSVGDGDVNLSDVTVLGKTIINGGGPNSIVMYNFNGQTVIVDVPEGANVRLVAQGNTSISNVSMESNGTLEESELTGAGTGFVNVVIPVGAQVTLSGSFSQVSVEAGGANVNVVSGNIATMTIAETATGAELNLGSAANVSTLNVNSQASITGQGTITNANINTSNVTIEQTPVNTTLASGVTANIGGQQQSSSSTTPPATGGGGGGGGAAPVVLDSTITQDPGNTGGAATVTIGADGKTITFDGEIAYYEANSTAAGFPPVSGNYVGVKVTAPTGIALGASTTLEIEGRAPIVGWNNFKDGDNYFFYYPKVTAAGEVFTFTVKWDGTDATADTFTINIAGTATLGVP